MTTPSGTISFSDANVELLLPWNRSATLHDDYLSMLSSVTVNPRNMGDWRNKTNHDIVAGSGFASATGFKNMTDGNPNMGTAGQHNVFGRRMTACWTNTPSDQLVLYFAGDQRGTWWSRIGISNHASPGSRLEYTRAGSAVPNGSYSAFGGADGGGTAWSWTVFGALSFNPGSRYIVVLYP